MDAASIDKHTFDVMKTERLRNALRRLNVDIEGWQHNDDDTVGILLTADAAFHLSCLLAPPKNTD